LKNVPDCPEPVRLVALEHHERLNGTGYPNNRQGSQVHPYSRIAAVADIFDAMTADRVYKPGMSPRQALGKIFADQGTLIDPAVVGMLIKLIGVYPVGVRVFLNSGESGVVLETNLDDGTRPIVRVDRDRMGQPMRNPDCVDLRETGQTIVRTER
jgi:HD-GYP domain-containing protein (c-di-GMP phosphodiesterase class II)